tara:strand:- start:4 stop:1038 length:1035 start_codon:yes stop_codon:yes gene_type:complete
MATDQEIRDKGFKYIPQQQYLQNPFELPTTPEEEPVINQGIVNTNAFTGGRGNDFSVYNPDPNSIVNRNYDPRYNYDANYETTFGTNLGDPETLTATGARYADPTTMQNIMKVAGGFIPGAGIANFIGNYLPVNKRSIMQNQLGGKGMMVNNIGQIVSGGGDYNTAANVMAGYNPYHMTAKTFDDRIEMATKKMTPGEYKDKRIAALKEAKQNFLDAEDESDLIYADQVKKKKLKKDNTIIGRYFKKRNEQKEIDLQKEIAAANLKAAQDAANITGQIAAQRGADEGVSGDGRGSRRGDADISESSRGGFATDDTAGFFAKGGRAGYFFGGRVNFKHGGLASIL